MAECNISRCTFEDCDFSNACANAAVFTDTSLLNCTLDKIYLFLARFDNCRMLGTSFADADMDGITVRGGDWSWTNLRLQNLKGLDLSEVKLVGADLYAADLTECNLTNADLTKTSLKDANLTSADLRGATLSESDLSTATLKETRLDVPQAIYYAQCRGAVVE